MGLTDSLDLAHYLRPGDRVVWGQGCAEPQTLTALLAGQRHRLGGITCFVGLPAAGVIRPEHTDALAIESYCGTGSNQRLHETGRLAIVPVHYAALPGLLAGGPLAADAVFVQVSAPDEHGRHSLGLADDYFSAALDTARVVIAEVNEQVPFSYGARTLSAADWTACVAASRPPAEPPAAGLPRRPGRGRAGRRAGRGRGHRAVRHRRAARGVPGRPGRAPGSGHPFRPAERRGDAPDPGPWPPGRGRPWTRAWPWAVSWAVRPRCPVRAP